MSELVLLHHNEPMTTSLAIAEGVQMEHKSVIQLVRKYADDLQEFGTSAFEMRKSGGRQTEFAWLNEGQSMFLLTLMRNTEIVIAFKKALVKSFLDLRDRIKSASTLDFSEPLSLSHRADISVAADRTFRSALRAGRAAGLPLPRALRQANDITLRKTGVDILNELDAMDVLSAPGAVTPSGRPEDSADRFLTAWQRGQTRHPYTICRVGDLLRAYRLWCLERGDLQIDEYSFQVRCGKWEGLKKKTGHTYKDATKGRPTSIRVIVPDSAERPSWAKIADWTWECIESFSATVGG